MSVRTALNDYVSKSNDLVLRKATESREIAASCEEVYETHLVFVQCNESCRVIITVGEDLDTEH